MSDEVKVSQAEAEKVVADTKAALANFDYTALVAVLLSAVKAGGVAALDDVVKNFGKLDFGPLTPVFLMVLTNVISVLKKLLEPVPEPTPAPVVPTPGGPTVDIK